MEGKPPDLIFSGSGGGWVFGITDALGLSLQVPKASRNPLPFLLGLSSREDQT